MVLLALGIGSASLLTPSKTNNLNNDTTFKVSSITPTQAILTAIAYGDNHTYNGQTVSYVHYTYFHTESDYYSIGLQGTVLNKGDVVMSVHVLFSNSKVELIHAWTLLP